MTREQSLVTTELARLIHEIGVAVEYLANLATSGIVDIEPEIMARVVFVCRELERTKKLYLESIELYGGGLKRMEVSI